MATGTGLPIPKGDNVLTQAPGVIDGDKYSSAQAWSKIAASGSSIAETGLDLVRKEMKQQQSRELADFENEHTDWFIKNRDAFSHNPKGFEDAANAHIEGSLQGVSPWLATHAQKFLNGKKNSTLQTILSETRNRDEKLAAESLEARRKSADNDVIGLAMAGRVTGQDGQADPNFVAALQTYDAVLESAVSTGLMTREKADLLREDLDGRAQGEAMSRDAVRIYREGGLEAANKFLREKVLENESLPLPAAKKYQVFNRAMSQVKIAAAEDKADRAEVVEVAKDLSKRLTSNQDVDPGEVQDTLNALSRTGAMARYNTLARDFAVSQATQQYRSGALSIGQFGQQVATMRGDNPALVTRESGGRLNAQNEWGYSGLYQWGAPRLATLGLYQPGPGENLETWSRTRMRDDPAKWTGTLNIPGHPEVRTVRDFMGNAEAQRTVRSLDVQRMDADSAAAGLDRFIGQTVGGVQITREGIRNMMHLGGKEGARLFLESGGAINRQDANGTTLADYARMGSKAPPSDPTMPPQGAVVAAVQSEYIKQAKGAWPQFRQMIERGHNPNAEDFAAMTYAARLSGDANWQREVEGMAAASLLGAAGASMTDAQRKTRLDEIYRTLDSSGWTADSERVFSAIKTQFDRQSKEVREDPVSFGARTQGIKVDPINLADGGAAMAGLQLRMQLARGVAAGQGVPVATPLRDADVNTIAAAIQSGSKEAGNAFALLNAMPDDMLRATLDNKTLKDAITSAALSTDPVRLNAVMSGLDQISARGAVGLVKQFGEEAWHRLKTWQTNLRYLGPDKMAEELTKHYDPATAEVRKKAEAEGRKEAGKKTSDEIVGAFDTSWGITPGVISRNVTGTTPLAPTDQGTIDALKADYQTIFARRYRENNGDSDKAHEETIDLMKTRWARSGVNGGKLMLRAPEQNYPAVNGSHDWMREQIEKELTARFGERESIDRGRGTMTPNWSYTLVTDRTTESEATAPGQVMSEFDRRPHRRPVSYEVVVTNHKTGKSDVVRDENQRPMRFRFDPSEAQQAARERFGEMRDEWPDSIGQF